MIYIYNAGPLFSEADQKQRKFEGKLLKRNRKRSSGLFRCQSNRSAIGSKRTLEQSDDI
jgi:hypothetical protein